MANNLYELLEVNPAASQEAIAAAYQRLHAKFVGPASAGEDDATNQLIALREAHHILGDPERRRRYDEKLAARQTEAVVSTDEPRPFLKLLAIASIIGACGVGYAKYQSDQEKARLERDKAIAAAKIAEIEADKEAKKAYEEKLAADQARRQQQREESMERYNRERDLAYANQVSRDIQRGEAQSRRERENEERQRATAERQQKYEAEQQLAREKAYLRQLEAENSRYRRY